MCKHTLITIAAAITAPSLTIGVAYAQEQARADMNATAYVAPSNDDGGYMVARVVGYFCRGATGPLLASEEDQLPHCESVKALPHPYAVQLWEGGE